MQDALEAIDTLYIKGMQPAMTQLHTGKEAPGRDGRPVLPMKAAIIGLPNVGKSTLFNALAAAEVPTENRPFCTIDPNVARVPIPDPRLDAVAEASGMQRKV